MAENKTILICGATGFIGRNLLDYYSNNTDYKIRAVYHKREKPAGYKNVEWVRADLTLEKDVDVCMTGIDIVLQFAAVTTGAKDIVSKPYIHVTDNVIMNSLLLRKSFEHKIENFIFPSCTIMYQKSEKALKESDYSPSDEILPFYYGAGHTKVYLEKMCKFYSNLGNTKYTVLRHSNIYGPHDKFDLEKSHVTGASITKVMQNQDGKIEVWGSGEEKRDLLYVKDMVECVDMVLNKQTTNYELFNVGLGVGIKIKNLVQKIITISKKDAIIYHNMDRPSVPTSLYLDCSLIKNKIGWQPKYSLEEGLKETIKWYKENI